MNSFSFTFIDDRYSSFNAVGKETSTFILSNQFQHLFSLVQSVADNETDVTVPGYIITETRYKIVDYTIPFISQGFYFWIKSSSVSTDLLNLLFSISCFQGIRIFMVFISTANVQ